MKLPLTPKDFNLTPEQLTDLVTGAQTYLPPEPDPLDDERLTVPEPEEL